MVSRVSAAQRTSKRTEDLPAGFLNVEGISYFCKGSFNEIVSVQTGCREPRRDFEVRKKEINIISKMYGK